MASSDAQRSGAHDSTEDSNAEPAGAMPGPGPVSKALVGEAPAREGPGRDGREETLVKNDPDESSFGGPLDLDEPKGV